MVQPVVVVEVSLTDLITENSRGVKKLNSVLEYEDGAYRMMSMVPGVSSIHPVFERIREDKKVEKSDLRLSQMLRKSNY